mmetsp:Transcript_96864/g.296101  ORF Transcript_96864/g.296101 Transcript_96864/m.296101 type:complete len:206 (-) Transcript_96864:155-772(-)
MRRNISAAKNAKHMSIKTLSQSSGSAKPSPWASALRSVSMQMSKKLSRFTRLMKNSEIVAFKPLRMDRWTLVFFFNASFSRSSAVMKAVLWMGSVSSTTSGEAEVRTVLSLSASDDFLSLCSKVCSWLGVSSASVSQNTVVDVLCKRTPRSGGLSSASDDGADAGTSAAPGGLSCSALTSTAWRVPSARATLHRRAPAPPSSEEA